MDTTKTKENKADIAPKVGGKVLSGKVVSVKMKDTVVVAVERYVKNAKYGKYMNFTKRYKAHDAGNTKQLGDIVSIQETRPISKDKHFKVMIETVKIVA